MTPEQQAAIERAMLRRQQQAAIERAQQKGGVSTNSQAIDELRNKMRAMAVGGADMASFGLSDEMSGAVEGIKGAVSGDGYMPAYDAERERVRAGQEQLRRAEPSAYMGGQVLGGLAASVPSMGVAAGKTLLGTAARGGALGAVEGFGYGYGSGEGTGDRFRRGLRDGAMGGAVGGAAPYAVAGGKAMWNAVADPTTGILDALLDRASKGKANRAIADTVTSAGATPDDVARRVALAAQQGQPEYRVMDALGIPGQRTASGIARSGGEAGDEIAAFLQQRQLDQGDRVSGFVEDAFDVKGTTAAKTKKAIEEARDAAANANYAAARGNSIPVNLSNALDSLDESMRGINSIDGGKTGLKETAIGRKLDGIKKQLQSDSYSTIDFAEVLETKSELGRTISAMKRRGERVPPAIANVYRDLDVALEASSDLYRNANDSFRKSSQAMDAVDEGARMASRGRAADNVPTFQGMAPEQQGAARVGYGDTLLGKLESVSAPTANRAKALQTSKRKGEAAAMSLAPDEYAARLARENDMWEVQNRSLGGSRTADNQADQAAMTALAGEVIAPGGGASLPQIARSLMDKARPYARGQTDKTRKMIAAALMSSDPEAAIAAAMRSDGRGESMRRILEALARSSGRVATTQ